MYTYAACISQQGFFYQVGSFMKLCYWWSAVVMLYFNNRYV